MSDYGDNVKYKWTPDAMTLLVSVWTDKQVQKQLTYAEGPHLIWESIARYMRKKGYTVSARQCRSRMKQLLVCYREAKRAGTRAGVEQYYESIDKVLKNKKYGSNDEDNGVDTVDATVPVKSPPKDVKTSKNLKMRLNKYSEPIESLIRTEALSPLWHLAHEEEYPESPESNETVLAQPYRTFSPTRDAATNTLNARSQLLTKGTRRSADDPQMRRESRPANSVPNNRFGEMIYQNAVQNVQNQIIQENMQQRNFLQNQFLQDDEGPLMMKPGQVYRRNEAFCVNDESAPPKLRSGRIDVAITSNEAPNVENPIRMQNQLQQTCPIDNRAMPQEPLRGNFAQNLALNYKQYKDAAPNIAFAGAANNNVHESRQRPTADYSPETAVNLNDAFCQIHKNDRNQRLMNVSYEQQQPIDNEVLRAMNATTVTNNATFNDDTISIEFLEGSRSPSDNDETANASKSLCGNSDGMPSVPARKKKAQKLEHLVLNAITSQSEVVNKILAAQDAMVTRFLDLDRDRQNRLENRLDHLMSVVHASVMNNKSPDKESDGNSAASAAHPSEPLISSLAPPPPPGAIPPKLDLVPPKPCRVPCTVASSNVELINKNVVATRPGVVSPIKQPQPGAIWSKLGPVSQSPFVKAQQQLGFYRAGPASNTEARTQSSAERKIARDMESLSTDRRAVIFETEKFLETEKRTEEQAENARIIAKMSQEVAARRKLFDSRAEPNPGIILSAAFLDAERRVSSTDYDYPGLPVGSSSAGVADADNNDDNDDDDLLLLAGQVENYERLRRLNLQSVIPDKPCDTSTPAKTAIPPHCHDEDRLPKQTIQQLAQLVMKSARWRDAAVDERTVNRFPSDQRAAHDLNVPSLRNGIGSTSEEAAARRVKNVTDRGKSFAAEMAERESRNKALGWLRDGYSYGNERQLANDDGVEWADRRAPYEAPGAPPARKSHPMGFTMEYMNPQGHRIERRVGFHPDVAASNPHERRDIGFVDKIGTYPRQRRATLDFYDDDRRKHSSLPPIDKNMIDRYVHEARDLVAGKEIDKEQERDSDEDEEFLDTTMSMQPQPRKNSLASSNTSNGKSANCVVS